jgi:hypothetical protein
MIGPADRLSLLDRPLSSAFEVRLVALPPGRGRRYREADWRDALVVIERGDVELECVGGSRRRFGRGDVLWLSGMPLLALHNPGRDSALLVAVSRRRALRRPPKPARRSAR